MKELKAELKRGILHGKIIYVMMMVAISIWHLGGQKICRRR